MTKLKKHLKEKDIHETIDSFIQLCTVFALEKPSKTGNVDNVTKLIEGVFRRNLKRLQAIHLLIDGTDDFASATQEIMRNILEDLVCVQYIFGAEEEEMEGLTERFFDFQWVQLKIDLDFYIQIGVPLTRGMLPKRVKKIEKEFSRVVDKYSGSKRPFRDKDGKLASSWIRKGVEDLLIELKDRDRENSNYIELLSRMYIEGNRNTHLNPSAILILIDLEDDKFHNKDWHIMAYQSYVMSGLCMCWLLQAYLDGVPSKVWKNMPELDDKLHEVEEFLAYCIYHISELHAY